MRATAFGVLVGVVGLASCVFELGEVVEPGVGGGGFGASGGAGGSGAAGGSVSTTQRTRIDVDTSSLSGSHGDFPLLVEIGPSNLDYGLAGDDGEAIRFYAEDGTTLLAHDIERWEPNGRSHVWVRLPDVSAGANAVLWLYAGEADPRPALEASSVWSSYAAVYHLADSPPAAVNDSSVGARHGSAVMMSAADAVNARFGIGYALDGTAGASPHVNLGGEDIFRVPPSGVLTAELWFQRSSTGDNDGYLMAMEGCCLGWGLSWVPVPLQLRSSVGVTNCCSDVSTYAYAQFVMPGGDNDYDWHHLVAVMDRGGAMTTVYLDGVVAQTEPIVASAEVGQGDLLLGTDFAGDDGFDGIIDEVRFSTRVVPADWVGLQYATMAGDAVTVGEPESL